ncbi:MAG: WD40-repeat-containing domain protein [Olpidium bornovanus]|uniref:WD40-repeat-containing domain protein n=1 Tax=Olpidium bornovanus TaxID=278681 RepID=A0A8H7ZT94_9FUNG|nr:MAG: WD40-repeat-containing domain protein [Olpidium bornovanus]
MDRPPIQPAAGAPPAPAAGGNITDSAASPDSAAPGSPGAAASREGGSGGEKTTAAAGGSSAAGSGGRGTVSEEKDAKATAPEGGASRPVSSAAPPAAAREDSRSPNYSIRFLLAGHRRAVSSVKFSPDGAWLASACDKYVCSASDDTLLMIWNVEKKECVKTLTGHTGYVFCVNYNPAAATITVDCHPSGTMIASGAVEDDCSIRIWAREGD